MNVPQPEPVTFSADEERLVEQIEFDVHECGDRDAVLRSCSAGAQLTRSLLDRGAIPVIRLQYFNDPDLNIGGRGKSRADVFAANGATGEAMIHHPHFLKFLRYFIYGADLPDTTVAGFRQILIDDAGTSGMILDQLRRFASAESRRLRSRRPGDLREEFFKLALECGVDGHVARSVRDAVREAR